jgi:NAD(P)-dependent dehydrogenase (short-subunit alcohol dehydrogenase family)
LLTYNPPGIGQYTAYALAKHGITRLALCDLNTAGLRSTISELKSRHGTGLEIAAFHMDTSNEESVESGIAETVRAFGRIDVAVNNAGIGGPPKPTTEVEKGEWEKVMGVNLTGVWMCQRAQIRQMLKQEYVLADK